jgi:mitotic spindle assembly checkpoint protein MAD2B
MGSDLGKISAIHDFNKINRTLFIEETFADFLELSFHSILFHRAVYPPGIFQRKQKYRVPVHVTCHPDVQTYIRDSVKDLAPNLARGSISKSNFRIVDSRETPVEEFHFRFNVDQSENEILSFKDLCLSQIEESLRGFLLRLSDVNLYLKFEDSIWGHRL